MQTLLKRWQLITAVLLIAAYLILVVFMKQPLSSWLMVVGLWLIILVITYIGTMAGILGVLVQAITRTPQSAVPFYRAAFRLGTQNPTILAAYGLILLRENNAKSAMDCFDKALKNSSYFMSIKTLKCNKAIALWKLDRIDEAIDQYLDVIETYGTEGQKFIVDQSMDEEGIKALVADNPYLYTQDYTTLGFLYTLKGDYISADFYSRAALIKEEGYAAAYDNLGQIAYFQEDLPTAEAYFNKALELNPKLADSLYFSALIAKKQGHIDKARDLLSQARACSLDGLSSIRYEMIDEAMASL